MNTSKRINETASNQYILLACIVVLILYLYVFFHSNFQESSPCNNSHLHRQQNTSGNIELALCKVPSSQSRPLFKYEEQSPHQSQPKQEISSMDVPINKDPSHSVLENKGDSNTKMDSNNGIETENSKLIIVLSRLWAKVILDEYQNKKINK